MEGSLEVKEGQTNKKKNPAIYTIQGNMSLDFHEGKFVDDKVRFWI